MLQSSYVYKGVRHTNSEEVGSAFYAAFEPVAAGTQAWLYGKPVVDHDATHAMRIAPYENGETAMRS